MRVLHYFHRRLLKTRGRQREVALLRSAWYCTSLPLQLPHWRPPPPPPSTLESLPNQANTMQTLCAKHKGSSTFLYALNYATVFIAIALCITQFVLSHFNSLYSFTLLIYRLSDLSSTNFIITYCTFFK